MDWDLGIDWNAFDIGGGVKGDDVGEEGEEGEMDFDSLEQPSMGMLLFSFFHCLSTLSLLTTLNLVPQRD